MTHNERDPQIVFDEILGAEAGMLGDFSNLPVLDAQGHKILTELQQAHTDQDAEVTEQERILEETKIRWAGKIATILDAKYTRRDEVRSTLASTETQLVEGFREGSIEPEVLVYARGLLEYSPNGINFEEAAEELALYRKLLPGTRVLIYWWPPGSSEKKDKGVRIRDGGILSAQPSPDVDPKHFFNLYNLDLLFPYTGGRVERHLASKALSGTAPMHDNLVLDESEIQETISIWAQYNIDRLTPKLNKRTKQYDKPHPMYHAIPELVILDTLQPTIPEYLEAKALALELVKLHLREEPTDPLMLAGLPSVETLDRDAYENILRQLARTYGRNSIEQMLAGTYEPTQWDDINERDRPTFAAVAQAILDLEAAPV